MSRSAQLPIEIQCQIIKLCLRDWTAKLENHTKPRNDDGNKLKSTLRIWSSKVYDALMLSLTCKSFHAIVQHIQKDPTLFDGAVDLIQEPGSITYLSDDFRAQCYSDPWETPNVMYKTQIFIKNSRYVSSTKEGRQAERQEYHASVRAWLMTHMCRLDVMWDEIDLNLDLTPFPRLRALTMYWPYGEDHQIRGITYPHECDSHDRSSICSTPRDEQWALIQMDSVIDEHFPVEAFERFLPTGLAITHILDFEHHHCGVHKWSDRPCVAYLRFESVQSSRSGHRMKSLTCLQEYARPGQDTLMRLIDLKKLKVNK